VTFHYFTLTFDFDNRQLF